MRFGQAKKEDKSVVKWSGREGWKGGSEIGRKTNVF